MKLKSILNEYKKPKFEVKYAASKRGKIRVSKFLTLKDAKKYLKDVRKQGFNGIIVADGKPIKEK